MWRSRGKTRASLSQPSSERASKKEHSDRQGFRIQVQRHWYDGGRCKGQGIGYYDVMEHITTRLDG